MQNPLALGSGEGMKEESQGQPRFISGGYDLGTIVAFMRAIVEGGKRSGTAQDLQESSRYDGKKSTFLSKVYASARYKLGELKVNSDNGQREFYVLPLTDETLDERTAQNARVLAFLNLPLHAQVYVDFGGETLPDGKTMEAYLKDTLKVSTGTLDTARQVLRRSAQYAGLFDQIPNQLVLPQGVELPHEFSLPNRLRKNAPPPVSRHIEAPATFEVPTTVEVSARVEQQEEVTTPVDNTPVNLALPQQQEGRIPNEAEVPVEPRKAEVSPESLAALPPLLTVLLQDYARKHEKWSKERREQWLEVFTHNFRYVNDDNE